MNPNEILGKTFACECGRTHKVPTKRLIYAESALEQLSDTLGSFTESRRVVLVADQRTWAIAGERARQTLETDGWLTDHIIVPDADHSGPVCDDKTFSWLNERFHQCDIALAVGSGVINDLTKWVSFERSVPYAVIATAASMNGYTSANVAPAIKGVKTLIKAHAPMAVFAVPSIIVNAPFELTAAGLGDVIAKPVSSADWLLNSVFHGENFCRYCSEMLNTIEPLYFDRPQDIRDRKPKAVEALFNALLYSGIAMTIIGTSAPASGGEHLLSHTLDMISSVDGEPHDLHGRQVGLGTLFASAVYERILQTDTYNSRDLPKDIDSAFWGNLAENVREQYQQKKPALKTMHERLNDGKTWRLFLNTCKTQVRPPQQIKDCLRTAGAAHTFADIGCSRERFLAAALHMHEIRKRTTVIDLAWMLGILPDAADDIIDRWLTS